MRRLAVGVVVATAAACGNPPGSAGVVDAGSGCPDLDGPATEVSIQELHAGAASGRVTVRDVVVTYVKPRQGVVWVQEPEGGRQSGIRIAVQGPTASGTAVDDLRPGDVVDAVELRVEGGILRLDACTPDGALVRTATGGQATATVLDPAELAADAAEAAAWQDVLVTFEDVRAAAPPIHALTDTGDDWDFMVVPMTDGVLWDVQTLFPDGPPVPPSIDFPDCYASITGVLGEPRFDEYAGHPPAGRQLLSRSTDDAIDGTGCPPLEDTAEACADGADNDRSGLVDCADRGCDAPADDPALCERATTIVEIQTGEFDRASGRAMLAQAVVVAVNLPTHNPAYGDGFWIQDAAGATARGGLYVRAAPGPLAPGDTLDLRGRVVELTTGSLTPLRTELWYVELGAAAAGSAPAPVTVSIEQAIYGGCGTCARSYDDVLVRVDAVSVSEVVGGGFAVTDGAHTLYVADGLAPGVASAVEVGDCVAVTGVKSAGEASILPRSAADIVAADGC